MKLAKLIKSVIVFTSLSVSVAQAAQQQTTRVVPYYGDEFYRALKAGVSNEDLENKIKAVLRSFHVKRASGNDLIVNSCMQAQGQGRCYAHTAIGYNAARVFLMGNYYLIKDGNNGYAVHDVYCDKDRPVSDFRRDFPSPGTIPDNKVINVEHTWPQSHFTRRFPDEVQKSDLHHLFPTDSQINAIRGNNMFGEVSHDLMELKCPASRFGLGSGGSDEVFEPPQDHKGNVARALFYFSVRYDMPINQLEEVILRKWNKEDPVDAEEMRRNEEIFKAQGNRNPFIDFPELADRIADF
ncbi:endonuclease I family protein [uncultured Bdellovibrio sp.]|uniref:endonuclease I family protein n=1 Tax=Bdellovibrio sp. HCB-162 TaxID=3394234 RepID=UPI0025CE03BA|nr:endonuclease [uncultured Bdellovibrio sp.]